MTDIKQGDIIHLKDEQTIQDNYDNGKGLQASELTVSRIRKFSHRGIGKSWEFFEFDDSDLILVRVSIDEFSEWRVYFKPDDWVPGNRKDCVENGQTWVFKEPDEDFTYDDLEYADTFVDGEENVFRGKGGSLADNSVHGGLFLITEWLCDNPIDNPEVLVLETGGISTENGGFVTFYQGATVQDHEVELFARN